MSEGLIGELKLFAGDFEIEGWMFCDGRTLNAQQHPQLMKAIGNRVPDLRGRVPVHAQRDIGVLSGSETVKISVAQLPKHAHGVAATRSAQNTTTPAGHALANKAAFRAYGNQANTALGTKSIAATSGGGAPHDNMMPFAALHYLIATRGYEPSSDRMSGSEAFLGEVRPFAFFHTTPGWKHCNGALLSIEEYSALYSILGNRFGGDGHSTFALPNLKDRVVLGAGAGPGLTPRRLGDLGGRREVHLEPKHLPDHTHALIASGAAAQSDMASTLAAGAQPMYGSDASLVALSPHAVAPAGGQRAHNNMQPYVTISFCICVEAGLYPPRAS